MKVLVLTPLRQENKEKIAKEFPEFSYTYSSRSNVTQEEIDQHDIIIGNPGYHVDINRENVKLIQLNSAGSDGYIKEGILHPNTLLANGSGVHSDAMAEHTIGMILSMNKRLLEYRNHQKDHHWDKPKDGKELFHSNVAIIGFGDIGYELAKRLKGFDCHIIGIKRRVSEKPDVVDELYTMDHLKEVLSKADYIISCLPHTSDTIHIFNETTFSYMKDDATFINIGRGSAVDTVALKKVLDQGKFDSVCLDVLEQEPLSKEDTLWDYDKVFITPHVASGYQWSSVQDNFTKLVISNMHHYLNHETLENEVDFTTGYRKIVTYKQ